MFQLVPPQGVREMRVDPIAVARRSYQAYVDKNRAEIEAVLGENFRFTSPLDNRIDRETYLARCWPNSATLAGFDFVRLVSIGNHAVVTYEATSTDGKRFRNTEILTVRQGKITEVEVYFGWSIPHEAPEGEFIDQR
jgi:ketosteroid isomerase-like protein